jgi:hypothetical protein
VLARARRLLRRVPAPLAALLALSALCSLAWAVVIPPLQGNDEIAHFSYTQRMVERGDLPQDVDERENPYSTEAVTAALWAGLRQLVGNLAARPAWTEADLEGWERVRATLGDADRADGTGPNPARQNPPLYYAYEAVPYAVASAAGGDLFDRLFAMRLWSVLLHVATVALAWLVAGELLGGALWIRALATSAVALHPQLAYLGGMVNPDTAMGLLGSAFLYAAILVVKRGPTPARLAALAATTAALALTHARALPFVVPALLVVALAAWRLRARPARALALGGGALACVAAGAVAFWAITWGAGGEADGGLAGGGDGARPFQASEFASYVWQFYLPRLPFQDPMIGPDYDWRVAFSDTFWGVFASLEVLYPDGLYDLLRWLSLIGLVALAVALVGRRAELRGHWPLLAVLATTVAALVLGLHLAAYRAMLSNPEDPIIVGRYLFPLIALLGAAVAFVVSSLPRRVAPYVASLVVALGVVLQLAGLGLALGRFYA